GRNGSVCQKLAAGWLNVKRTSKESLKRGLGLPQRLNGREIEMRVLAIAAIITSLAVAAFDEEDPSKAERERFAEPKKKEAEEIEKAYQDALKRMSREQPAKKTDKWDPWRNSR